jgi:Ca2+-binding RTX toxin-like protein
MINQRLVVTTDTVIGADEVIDIVAGVPWTGAVYVTTSASDPVKTPSLTNNGVVRSIDALPYTSSWGAAGVTYAAGPGDGVVLNNGEIHVSSLNFIATGIEDAGEGGRHINTGLIDVEATNYVSIGIWSRRWTPYLETAVVANSGEIQASGRGATGVMIQVGRVENSGAIVVHATSDAPEFEAVGLAALGTYLVNTGSIVATNSGSTASAAVWIRPYSFNSARDSVIDNRGVLTGDYGVLEWSGAHVETQVFNTGTINGKVDLGGGDDVFVNGGVLNGSALLGTGEDYYDGRGGTSSGVVDGGDGLDLLVGGALADILAGGTGDDALVGGTGDDVLTGGAGSDVFGLDGGADRITDFDAGADRLALAGATLLSATVSGGATVLTYAGGSVRVEGVTNLSLSQWQALTTGAILAGTAGDDLLSSTAGQDALVGGAGLDTVSWSTAGAGVSVDLHLAGAQDTGGAGLDILVGIENLTGSAHVDTLTGDEAGNILRGLAGGDALRGAGGDDILDGGAGDDVIDGGAGVDVVDYSRATAGVTVNLAYQTQTTAMGTDILYSIEAALGSAFDDVLIGSRLQGGDGADQMTGTEGQDLLIGDSGNDGMSAGGGADELRGDDGDDLINGGAGDDFISGGAGDDVIIGGYGLDIVTGGAGADTFRFLARTDSYYPYGSNFVSDLIRDFQTGVDKIDLTALKVTDYWITTDIGYRTLHLTTTDGTMEIRYIGDLTEDDVLWRMDFSGGAGPDVVSGGADDDRIGGLAGDDQLFGAVGDDRLFGGLGDDLLNGGDGVDTASYELAAAAMLVSLETGKAWGEGVDGLVSIENLRGSRYGDVLIGDLGGNRIEGLAGDDVLNGAEGDDRLEGGAGGDTLYGGDGGDTLLGGGDADVLLGQAGGDALLGGAGGDLLNGGDGDDVLQGESGDDLLVGETGADIVYGDGGVDTLYGQEGDDTLVGGDGGDLLDGGAGADLMVGGAGLDILVGREGDDVMNGQADSDVLVGEDGADQLYGDMGDDFMAGGAGDDTLVGDGGYYESFGLGGNDTLYGGTGADVLLGGMGADLVAGEEGDDLLLGGIGGDLLVGGAGNDTLYGDDVTNAMGGGNDSLIGGEGLDTLVGGWGADLLIGDAGGDTLTGGLDADIFLFRAVGDSAGVDIDLITDFEKGVDRVDLQPIDAVAGGADDAFTFVNAFTGVAGQANLTYLIDSNRTVFQGDVNGDGLADFVLAVNGQLNEASGWML